MKLDRIIVAVQWWLQGHPNKWRPWFVARIGNWIADVRFWSWYRKQPDDPIGTAATTMIEWRISLSNNYTSTNARNVTFKFPDDETNA